MTRDRLNELIYDEPHGDYHARRGEFLTSHLLIHAFESTERFVDSLNGLDSDCQAYAFGRASHVHLLEGLNAFAAEYTVGGPINPWTGKGYGTQTKAFAAWAAKQDRDAISRDDYELIKRMTEACRSNRAVAQLLENGRSEVTARTVYAGVPCQIRIDWLGEINGRRFLLDYKTTRDLSTFWPHQFNAYSYLVQQSFYWAVAEQITGEELPVVLLACEKSADAPVSLIRLKRERLAEQAAKNEAKIREIAGVLEAWQQSKNPNPGAIVSPTD